MPWRELVPEAELEDGKPRRVEVDGRAFCVVKACGGIHVLDDVCTHEDYSLSEGEVFEEFCEIECPKHASTFDLRTGEPTCLPATQPVKVYAVQVEDGVVTAEVDE